MNNVIKLAGNAYRFNAGFLESAALNEDNSIDENSWAEVEDMDPVTKQIVMKLFAGIPRGQFTRGPWCWMGRALVQCDAANQVPLNAKVILQVTNDHVTAEDSTLVALAPSFHAVLSHLVGLWDDETKFGPDPDAFNNVIEAAKELLKQCPDRGDE